MILGRTGATRRLAVAAAVFAFAVSAQSLAQQPGGPPPPGATPPAGVTPPAGTPPSPYAPLGTHLQEHLKVDKPPVTREFTVKSQTSLVHVGLGDSFSLTEEGIAAGKLMLEGLETKNMDKIREASKVWDRIIPLENYGGEYTALQWFATYILADDEEKQKMIADPFIRQFFDMYGPDDYAGLKEFLQRKYHIRDLGDEYTKEGQRRKADLELTILFNNPRREEWEQTSKLLKLLDIKPGQHIADIGSGAGYYTVKLSKLVGDTGRVYAIETEEDRVAYVEEALKRQNIKNVESVRTDGNTLALGDRKVDGALMVSLYHNIYAKSTARERNSLIQSIRDSLKPDGKLYIVDNGVVEPGVLPYHGPYIAKELVIAQLENYGFTLIRDEQYIPQRYLLVFRKD